MSSVAPMLAEHVLLQRTRKSLPRAVKRLERSRGFLKPHDYEGRAAMLARIAASLPAMGRIARVTTLGKVRP